MELWVAHHHRSNVHHAPQWAQRFPHGRNINAHHNMVAEPWFNTVPHRDHVTRDTGKNKPCVRGCKQALLGTQSDGNPWSPVQDVKVPVSGRRQFCSQHAERHVPQPKAYSVASRGSLKMWWMFSWLHGDRTPSLRGLTRQCWRHRRSSSMARWISQWRNGEQVPHSANCSEDVQ